MQVLFDWTARQVTKGQDAQGQWWLLEGECARCGKCCEEMGCDKLAHETLDGIPQASCAVQRTKPWHCAVYPRDPNAGLTVGCGYRWER